MAWFTEALKLAVAAWALWELRALRRAVEGARTPDPIVESFREVVEEIADSVVGPTLPHVLTEEEELAIERERYGTLGAQSGYQVAPYWLEQDARDAYEEEEALDV